MSTGHATLRQAKFGGEWLGMILGARLDEGMTHKGGAIRCAFSCAFGASAVAPAPIPLISQPKEGV